MARRTASAMAVIVADLLRRDNISADAMYWLQLALAEIYSRTTGVSSIRQAVFTLTASAAKQTIQTVPENFLSPLSLMVIKDDGTTYSPSYLSPQDFQDRASWRNGGSTSTGEVVFYTIEHTSRTTNLADNATNRHYLRELTFYFDDGIGAGNWKCAMTYLAAPFWLDADVASSYLECFPWWEHVLIWKAAALGARALRMPTSEIYETEAEQAIKRMYSVEMYAPDLLTVPHDIAVGLAASERFRVNVPQTIS